MRASLRVCSLEALEDCGSPRSPAARELVNTRDRVLKSGVSFTMMDKMYPSGRSRTIANRPRNVMKARMNREVVPPLFPLSKRADESDGMMRHL